MYQLSQSCSSFHPDHNCGSFYYRSADSYKWANREDTAAEEYQREAQLGFQWHKLYGAGSWFLDLGKEQASKRDQKPVSLVSLDELLNPARKKRANLNQLNIVKKPKIPAWGKILRYSCSPSRPSQISIVPTQMQRRRTQLLQYQLFSLSDGGVSLKVTPHVW